jgi:hypothetical protein
VTGSCHCSEITYEAEVDPATASICHCLDCQKLSGSPYRASVQAEVGAFRLLTGRPSIYVKTADSGNRRAQGFCPKCGAPIFSTSPNQPAAYTLRIGLLDQRAELAPRRRIWRHSALAWSEDISAVTSTARE